MSERLVWEDVLEVGSLSQVFAGREDIKEGRGYHESVCPECGEPLFLLPLPPVKTQLPFMLMHGSLGNQEYTKEVGMGPCWGMFHKKPMEDPVLVWRDEEARQFADEYHHPELREEGAACRE